MNSIERVTCCVAISGVRLIEQRHLCNLTIQSGWYITMITDATSCDYLIFISYLYMDIEQISISHVVFMPHFI
jgi:hypothetical protein